MLAGMQRTNLNLSLELELLDGELAGRCQDGIGGQRRFSGRLGLIGRSIRASLRKRPARPGAQRRFPQTKGTQC
jgi:hypothetical protein